MYRFTDTFQAHDQNRQPYSFSVEQRTETAHLHAWVQDNRFHLSCIGNRHILNTPAFLHGTFEMQFHFTYMDVYRPNFTLFFGYDQAARQGLGLRFTYDLAKCITLTLIASSTDSTTELDSRTLTLTAPLEETPYAFVLRIDEDSIHGSFDGMEYAIPCTPVPGKLAIERSNYMGELIIHSIRFSSDDAFPRECVIPETTAEIPCINGGDIPYTVTWSLEKIQEEYYLTSVLNGGTRTRKVDREDRPGQYVAEKDWMTDPYIGLIRNGNREIYAIASGVRAFIDPNIYWDCQKALFGDTELPIVNTYRIPAHLIGDDTTVLFGYRDLTCNGYSMQAGGCEFRYTWQGTLLDFGPPLDGRDAFALKSQEDKLALTFIPEDCYRRSEVIDHIRYNHYFDVSEMPQFTLEMLTRTDPAYLAATATVMNVFESAVIHTLQPAVTVASAALDYHLLRFSVTVPQMPLGVWKIGFSITYGDREYHRFVKTFEVFDKDSDVNPALATGLPFAFSMPNEQKRLMRNSFDLWNPARSCDVEHYITCITDTPVEAEIRQSWHLIKPFKRQWFAWLTSRTCTDWQVENHPEVVKNADYLFTSWQELVMDMSQSGLYPVRQDHHLYENFMMRESVRVPILNDFLSENPGIAAQLEYRPGDRFTFRHFVQLMQLCAPEWMAYQNRRGLEIIRQHNRELTAINPNFRRSLYGPINSYVTPTLTAHTLKAYGHSDPQSLSTDVFTGFCVFEDYPYSCSYQTYRGAFMVMTILLESPDLTLYPEQYTGSKGGCIDGAVKNAHPPMGKYELLPYQNSTHAFEFVYNTAYRLPDGYRYWNTYGFHRSDYTDEFMNKLILDWRHVVEKKPAKPLRTTAFLAEYTDREDVFEALLNGCFLNNRTESGHGLVYECSREAGIPNGFALKYESLKTLSADECDVIVLPNLAYADRDSVAHIRRLYESGVNLIAVSEIDGLEDIFGVTPDRREVQIHSVSYGGESEFVRPKQSFLSYRPTVARTVMTSEAGDPVVLCTDRTLLLNTSVINLGCSDSIACYVGKSSHIVGSLIRRLLRDYLRKLSSPLALGENVGITLFETADGRRELLVIDYTPFDNAEHGVRQAVVRMNLPTVTDVRCDKEIFVGKRDGIVRELRFDILPHESVFVDLRECNL